MEDTEIYTVILSLWGLFVYFIIACGGTHYVINKILTSCYKLYYKRYYNKLYRAITLISKCPVQLYNRDSITERCEICNVLYKENDILTMLPCQHLFHKNCIIRNVTKSKRCPICYNQIIVSTKLTTAAI